MRLGKLVLAMGILLVLAGLAGCGDSQNSSAPSSKLTDEQQIQNVLTEIITRWHYHDKAGLYDNEFPYVRTRFTFDAYLNTKEMQLDADTVKGINLLKAHIFDKDSALADVEVVFEGPTGKISTMKDTYRLYWVGNRWIRPTLGLFEAEQEYEQIRRAADSAAAAENDSD